MQSRAFPQLATKDNWLKEQYTLARSLEREIIIYAGPTNSGKTYSAFEHLNKATSGCYLAPLRLLALEGYDRLEAAGVTCSLLTGEERIEKEGSSFTSSTIEMANFSRVIDVGIVDEAQMIEDPDRAWAWFASLIGLPARKLIIACSLDAEEPLLSLFKWLNEKVTVVHLERKSELMVTPRSTSLKSLTPGTAVIAFSRRDIIILKSIFDELKVKTAVIYGALGPEVRREQARLFSSGEASVLLSTDAIAMGLNLPIQHVCFYSTEKFNGKISQPLHFRLLQQIAGRAGRYGFCDKGFVSGLSFAAQQFIRECMLKSEPIYIKGIPISPSTEQIQLISASTTGASKNSIAFILSQFMIQYPQKENVYHQITEEMMFIANLIDKVAGGLALQTKFNFTLAPIDIKSDLVMSSFTSAITSVSKGTPYSMVRVRGKHLSTDSDLFNAEQLVKWNNAYRWLHYRSPHYFPDLDVAIENAAELTDQITGALSRKIKKICPSCGTKLPPQFEHRFCNTCFSDR